MRAYAPIAAVLLFLSPATLLAATRLVSPAGVDVGDCTVAPCATFGYAIAQAVAGDTIDVAPGTYNETVNVNKTVIVLGGQRNVDARTRAVPGANDSLITGPVVISANDVVFNGFNVNCAACAPFGAGIVSTGTGIQLLNNVVTGNPIGMFPAGSNATIRFNRIFDNNNGLGVLASAGTGIYTDTGLTGSFIDQNAISGHETAQTNLIATTGVQVTNNTFALDATDANAVVLFNGTGTLISGNTITGGDSSQFFIGGGDSNITISNNNVSGGTSNAVSISDAGFGPNGLITVVSNTFVNMLRGVSVGAGNPTPIEVHLNRFEGNGTDIRTTVAAAVINGENNWFGCNEGPSVCGVISVFAGSTIDVDPWLVMGISASPNPMTVVQTSTVTADLTRNSAGAVVSPPYFPNGTTISFSATGGNVAPPAAPTNNGQASTTFTPSGAGAATASATLDAETVTVNITVTKLTPTVTLVSSQNPSNVGQSVTFTATVTAGATGTIQFQDNGVNIGAPVPITGNTAQLTTSTLTAGTHPITAVYSGDATYNAGTSNTVNQVVNKVTPAVTLVSSVNPSSAGQSVTFTAAVPVDATGTVQFQDNGVNIGLPVTVAGGSAQFTTSTLTVGTHPITAVYSGDAKYNGATSNTVNQVVNLATAGVTLASSVNPSFPGQSVTFTATLPADATGTVQFQDNGVNMGAPVTVAGGSAQFTTSTLAIGTHPITAVYSGDAKYSTATSNTVNQVVAQITPTVTLTSSANPSSSGQAVTFTATLPGDATGSVQFQDNGVNLGAPVTVAGGSAQFTTSTLTVGTHPITAVYSGDAKYTTATSNTVNQVVGAAGNADLGVTGSGSAAPVVTGSPTTVMFTITNAGPASAFNTALSSTIPAGATVTAATPSQGTCTIGATVNCTIGTVANGGTATVVLTITAPAAPGPATFTATVTSTSPDPVATNNSANVTLTIVTLSQIPALDPRMLALLAVALLAIAIRMMR